MKKALAALAACALLGAGTVLVAPSAHATTCNDGTWSFSTGRGTCSWHGGIDRGYGYDSYSGRGYSNGYGYSGRGYSNGYGYSGRGYSDGYGYSGRGYSNYDYGSRLSSTYGYDNFGW